MARWTMVILMWAGLGIGVALAKGGGGGGGHASVSHSSFTVRSGGAYSGVHSSEPSDSSSREYSAGVYHNTSGATLVTGLPRSSRPLSTNAGPSRPMSSPSMGAAPARSNVPPSNVSMVSSRSSPSFAPRVVVVRSTPRPWYSWQYWYNPWSSWHWWGWHAGYGWGWGPTYRLCQEQGDRCVLQEETSSADSAAQWLIAQGWYHADPWSNGPVEDLMVGGRVWRSGTPEFDAWIEAHR